VGWEYAVEVLVTAPVERVRRYLSPALGRLDPVEPDRPDGARLTRLTGSTSNPAWYAEQLAAVPDPFRVVGGPEIRRAVALLGRRLLEASPTGAASGAGSSHPN
jgi:hypothetical protein